MPPDLLPRLFSRFVADSKSTGVGLGLYIVSRIVGLHGGTITVTSALERGSVGGRAVRGEHELDGKVEQRSQALDDLLARSRLPQPLLRDLEARGIVQVWKTGTASR